ncbi:MAG: redoxin domain-containing protein [Solirubrobacterales bacterium]|nr:redoxin domain-containing protein [Solirubrobacterales bacterium]
MTSDRLALPKDAGGTLETRLVGRPLPDVQLQYAHEAFLSLAGLAGRRSLVVFFYPATEESMTPDEGLASGVDERRAVAWMGCEEKLQRMGYDVIGVSSQSAIEQARFASLIPLPFILLSDPELKLSDHPLHLPTTGARSERVYEPLALVVRRQEIVRVFHPIDPTYETPLVMRWIRSIERQ